MTVYNSSPGETIRAFHYTSLPTVPATSSTFRTDMHALSPKVNLQCKIVGAAVTFTLVLQGRVSPDASFAQIASLTNADVDASGVAFLTTQAYPEMQLTLSAIGGTATAFDAWIQV